MKARKVLLTGASGRLGQATLKLLLKMDIDIRLFALNTSSEQRKLNPYLKGDRVSIVYGNIINYKDVRKAVMGADIVLHTAALVSPEAEKRPDLAYKVNYLGTENIVRAIKEREDSDDVLLVYVGSVAQSGNRASSVCWGRIGDPLIPVPYDYYALSKTLAERTVIESGLKRWISLRQTGMLHNNLLSMKSGIEYHQPLNNHLEWVTVDDSARLLSKLCEEKIPEELIRNCYNVGGGEEFRLTAYDLIKRMFDLIDVDFRDVYSPDMFALRNFHGHYFMDSDKLESILPFREQSLDDFFREMKRKLPVTFSGVKYLPKNIVKNRLRAEAIKNPLTPLYWVKNEERNKIKAYFKSEAKMISISDWNQVKIDRNPEVKILDHGYDENKEDLELDIEDMRAAARFRGGQCLSSRMTKGDLWTKLKWKCSEGHEFVASPYLVLKTGHFCKKCLMPPWNYDYLAKSSEFIAQVWYADHDKNENNIYK